MIEGAEHLSIAVELLRKRNTGLISQASYTERMNALHKELADKAKEKQDEENKD